MRELPNTNFAFEVDIKEKTGKFLFDTKETDQSLAEELMLKRCKYDKLLKGVNTGILEDLEINSSPIMGLSPEGAWFPRGDTMTTLLQTGIGFICQFNPYCWAGELLGEGKICIMTADGNQYPIRFINTPFDVS